MSGCPAGICDGDLLCEHAVVVFDESTRHFGPAESSLPFDDPPLDPLAEISLLDRLMVALSARGDRRIGQAISNALLAVSYDLFYVPDELLVTVVERLVFEPEGDGDAESFASRQSRDGVSSATAGLHREAERAE